MSGEAGLVCRNDVLTLETRCNVASVNFPPRSSILCSLSG